MIDKLTDEESDCLAVIRLNKAIPKKEIRKSIRIGRIETEFLWRSKDNLWGRFGGGWDWHVGIQWGSTTVIVYLLVFTLRFSKERSMLKQSAQTEKGE